MDPQQKNISTALTFTKVKCSWSKRLFGRAHVLKHCHKGFLRLTTF